MRKTLGSVVMMLGVLAISRSAAAGTVTTAGAVTAIPNAGSMINVVGNGNFDEGPTNGQMPAGIYAAQGLTWHEGALSASLAGVVVPGSSSVPYYDTSPYFPSPLNGGTHVGQGNFFAGVATFSGVFVTQVGLTASTNGDQYLTAFNGAGAMIGQVHWSPGGTSSFIGIDTGAVPIKMIAYGNDDLWNGATYGIGGATIISDSWRWGGTCTLDAQCDDGNGCTTDTCNAGTCAHANNTAACDDGDACTQNDKCGGGVCGAGAPVVCAAQDQCHAAGVCSPATGACSNPSKVDGAACTDGNACTQTDTCQAGVCTGASPVTCTAQSQCHDVGACNPATGACSNPTKANGTACSDANLCDAAPTCNAGVCNGTPVVCAPLDQCHIAGTCNPATGTCSQPGKPDGTACTDNNACTQSDTCVAAVCVAGAPVVCTAKNGCHDVGVCNPLDGTCSDPSKTDGATCSDSNACTQTDSCKAGTCSGGSPVVCKAKDACHDVGTCGTADGKCSDPVKADGAACPGGACSKGTCVPSAVDGGTTTDAGTADAGTASDAGATTDGGTTDGGTTDGGAPDTSGCGCTMTPASPRFGLLGLGALALLGLRRRARRPAQEDRTR